MGSDGRIEHQLTNPLTLPGGRAGLVLTGSKELEPEARAMLLLAEGLFRLDITVSGDTLRTIVRNLSTGQLEMTGGAYGPDGGHVILGEAAAYEPARTAIEFTLGQPDDRVEVSVTLATLRFADRGTIRVSAQAIVRQGG
ncbi:MAG TPA: hypothetical protein VMU39_14685 [Solirubrobacteraceae bacterium]|nr:hypothetical protein [Solirubrobacteraceae bacterium]